jgi:protein-tyrosine phosphatase
VTSPLPVLESIFNFRDVGGLRTTDGRVVTTGRVFRADGLHRASERDVAALASVGLRTVLDLRTTGELADRGVFDHHGVVHRHLPLLAEVWDPEVLEIEAPAHEFLAARYLEILDEGAEPIGEALRTIAESPNLPLVFHCAAGKDRTGVLAAVLLALLGVADDDVVADYARSADAVLRFQEWTRTEHPEWHEAMANQPEAYAAAPAAAMQAVLDDVRLRWGSIAGYAADVGAGPDVVTALRTTLLTDAWR